MSHLPGLQLIIMSYGSLINIIYQGKRRPLETRFTNNMELFNEALVCFGFLHLYVFTDWGTDEEHKFFWGWSVVGIVILLSVVNLGVVIK